jgi:biotin carboxylase
MIDGKLHLTAISDRVFEYEKYEPFFIEIGDILPTALSGALQQNMYDLTQKAAMALGIRDGVVKGDLIICEGRGGAVFELTPRLGGPRFGTEMVPLSNGTNILKATIQQAMGEPVDLELLKPKHSGGMVNRSIFPCPGKVVEDVDLTMLEKQAGFYDFKWWREPLSVGDFVEEYTYGCGNVAYFIAVGEDRESAIRNANNIESKIKIKTTVECQ